MRKIENKKEYLEYIKPYEGNYGKLYGQEPDVFPCYSYIKNGRIHHINKVTNEEAFCQIQAIEYKTDRIILDLLLMFEKDTGKPPIIASSLSINENSQEWYLSDSFLSYCMGYAKKTQELELNDFTQTYADVASAYSAGRADAEFEAMKATEKDQAISKIQAK